MLFKKQISSNSEWLYNNLLFGGQLKRRSNHERAPQVINLCTSDRQTVIYYLAIHTQELIYFDSSPQ